jgi:hypothetical protein
VIVPRAGRQGSGRAERRRRAGAPDPVQILVDRLDLEKYKATSKGLTQFGDRREGTQRNPRRGDLDRGAAQELRLLDRAHRVRECARASGARVPATRLEAAGAGAAGAGAARRGAAGAGWRRTGRSRARRASHRDV